MKEGDDGVQNLIDGVRSFVEASQTKMDTVIAKLEVIEKSVGSRSEIAPKVNENDSGWIKLPDGERLKATELRTALLLGKVPDTAGLMVDTKTTAKLLNVSQRSLSRLDDLKAIPEPTRIGGTFIRWRLAEILAWMDATCPFRNDWKYPDESAALLK